ncbi:plasmid pRiA4b ORF-3 family protein [Companilactobacillus kimchiensis]|nr:plasmid pRiA4b ORF-3 family protein [Companilactobacillus kimchiensis]
MDKPIVAMEITVKLLDYKPSSWRKLIVPITLRYDQLHVLIQLAFGWKNSHLYSFMPKHTDIEYLDYVDELEDYYNTRPLAANEYYPYQDLVNDSVTYTYDFGADWRHQITLKRTLTFDELQNQPLPSCTLGSGGTRDEFGEDPEQITIPYNHKNINQMFELWARAGEQMIIADDIGLQDHFKE